MEWINLLTFHSSAVICLSRLGPNFPFFSFQCDKGRDVLTVLNKTTWKEPQARIDFVGWKRLIQRSSVLSFVVVTVLWVSLNCFNFKHSQENVKGSLKKSQNILLVITLNTYTYLGAATFPSEVFDRNFRQVYFVCIASTCLKLNYPIYRHTLHLIRRM